jgi:hypothetical protein
MPTKRNKEGLSPRCRPCLRAYANREDVRAKQSERLKRWRKENPEKVQKNNILHKPSPEKAKEYLSRYAKSDKGKEKRRLYRDKIRASGYFKRDTVRQKLREASQRWLKNNPQKAREYNKRSAEKPDRKIKKRYSTNLRRALGRAGAKKNETSIALLGSSIAEFFQYFETLFTEGMTWELFFQGEIHIDHKKPCCAFDLQNPEQLAECFHFSNLQPLWKRDNLRKRDLDRKLSIQPQLKQMAAATRETEISPT